MSDPVLRNCRVLIAEDEFLLADELQADLEEAGAIVIGPVSALADAIALIEVEQHIDAAILDANLGGEMVFPAADLLIARGVTIVFTTGYDASIIPSRFGTVTRCEKPTNIKSIIPLIERSMQG